MEKLSPLAIQVLLIFILIPLERYFPRLASGKLSIRHFATVLIIGSMAFLTGLLLTPGVVAALVRLLGPFQILSLARLPIPTPLGWVLSFLLVDFAAYLSHVLFHAAPPLWALHGVHHADEQVAGVTGLLHHPLEVLVNALLLFVFYVVFGVPVAVIVAYSSVEVAHAILSHANLAIPPAFDRLLRCVIVTPDMHRTHHSRDMLEGNANFSQVFPFWDWICGTYLAHPAAGESGLLTGLPAESQPTTFSAPALLAHPFRHRQPQPAAAGPLPS